MLWVVIFIRNDFILKTEKSYPQFKDLSRKRKLLSLLNLQYLDCPNSQKDFEDISIKFIRQVIDLRSIT